MLYVNADGSIQLTRGDTARLSITIENDLTNDTYEITENDTIRLTVKRTVKDEEPLFQKVIKGSNQFSIDPEDTHNLQFGKYIYDVELTTDKGDVFTIIVPTTLEILREVTC